MKKTILTRIKNRIAYEIDRFRNERAVDIVPLRIDDIGVYANRKDIRIEKILWEENIDFAPICVQEQANFQKNFASFISRYEAVFLDSTNPKFSFRHNHLLDDQNKVIYEPDWDFKHLPISNKFLPKPKKLKGTIAYLSNSGANHFGHWFHYTLTFLPVYWQFVKKEDIDYYYIGDCAISVFHIDSLVALGIDPSKIINYPCQADRSLMVVKHKLEAPDNGRFKYIDSFTFRFCRQLIKPEIKPEYPKKIYVKRGKVQMRQVVNEDQLIDFLKPLGFEILVMDGKNLQEQANYFANATQIVAPHGSALANLAFAQKGVTVLELFPFNYPDVTNFSFAACLQANYGYHIGDIVYGKKHINSANFYADILVNMPKMKELAEKLGIR